MTNPFIGTCQKFFTPFCINVQNICKKYLIITRICRFIPVMTTPSAATEKVCIEVDRRQHAQLAVISRKTGIPLDVLILIALRRFYESVH